MATTPQQTSLLSTEAAFADAVGKGTGIDPRVIFAQEEAEGAYAKGGTGGLNFLNLKSATVTSLNQPYVGSTSAGFAQFATLQQAENASIAEFKSSAIGINQPASTIEGQINQISASPWDQTHYGGGGKLTADFASFFGSPVGSASSEPIGINTAGQPVQTTGGGGNIFSGILGAFEKPGFGLVGPAASAANSGAVAVVPGLGTAESLFTGSGSFFSWIGNTKNIIRVGEVLGGSVLMLVGVIMIGRAAMSEGPAKQVAGAATTAAAPVRAVSRTRSRKSAQRRPQAPRRAPARPKMRNAPQVRSGTAYDRPKRGQPGSKRLAKGDTIPF